MDQQKRIKELESQLNDLEFLLKKTFNMTISVEETSYGAGFLCKECKCDLSLKIPHKEGCFIEKILSKVNKSFNLMVKNYQL